MQRRRLHRTKARRVPLCLGRRCSHLAIPSARSLACEIMRPGGRGHMRDCGTGDGRGLPETTGRTRVGKLRSCRIHGSQPLATGDPHALRSRDARHRPGQRFGTSAQCDQHASCSRRSGRKARTRRSWGKRVAGSVQGRSFGSLLPFSDREGGTRGRFWRSSSGSLMAKTNELGKSAHNDKNSKPRNKPAEQRQRRRAAWVQPSASSSSSASPGLRGPRTAGASSSF